MVGKTQPITRAHVERFEKLRMLGCICCRKHLLVQAFPVEVHHCLSGGRRRGHEYTLPLCGWHHRALRLEDLSTADMTRHYGPSVATQSKAFRAHFGSDDELLAEVNGLIGESQEAAA